jgi:hypothetical protein
MSFLKLLTDITFANKEQKEKELWDVEGILKNRLNEKLKFDTRPLQNYDNEVGKKGNTLTKSDKIVFEEENKWIIVDTKELHDYIKKNKLIKVFLNNLIIKLDWNIEIKKC